MCKKPFKNNTTSCEAPLQRGHFLCEKKNKFISLVTRVNVFISKQHKEREKERQL